ncbi:hypothetical protein K474DRAFT_1024979 [Panus rudis PR-1116 ss-1]|nr:hypothetical protein K474DRAFT_1024979 [Panus rudis PR-1116 ss-1]
MGSGIWSYLFRESSRRTVVHRSLQLCLCHNVPEKIASETAIVLTSPRILRELMDQRSASTNDRPDMKLIDIVTDGFNLGLMHSSAAWKRIRKAVAMFLTHEACSRYLPIQAVEGVQLLYDMIEDPDNAFRSQQDRDILSLTR